MAIAPVLKTGVRKDIWVRIPGPPLAHKRHLTAENTENAEGPPFFWFRLRHCDGVPRIRS